MSPSACRPVEPLRVKVPPGQVQGSSFADHSPIVPGEEDITQVGLAVHKHHADLAAIGTATTAGYHGILEAGAGDAVGEEAYQSVQVENEASMPVSAPSMRQFSRMFFFPLPSITIPCQSPRIGSAKREVKRMGRFSCPCRQPSLDHEHSACWQGQPPLPPNLTTVPGSMVSVAWGATVTTPFTRTSPRQAYVFGDELVVIGQVGWRSGKPPRRAGR